jgi:hypothetical protein
MIRDRALRWEGQYDLSDDRQRVEGLNEPKFIMDLLAVQELYRSHSRLII